MARTMQPHISMRNRFRRIGSAGFSLVEMLIVVVIIGLVMLFAFPRAGAVYDKAMLRGARTAITNMYLTARNTARTTNKVTVLRQLNDQIWVEVNNSPGTTKTVTHQPLSLAEEYKVTITSGEDSLKIDQRGMLQQSGRQFKYVFTRNGYADSVMINGYGRILR